MVKFVVSFERETRQVRDIVDAALRTIERAGGVSIPREYASERQNSELQDLIRQSFDGRRGQIDIHAYARLLRGSGLAAEELSFPLTVLNSDVFGHGTNFVFGMTVPIVEEEYVPSLTVSTSRIGNGRGWELTFATLLIHELGHFYGLVARSNPNGIFGTGTIQDGHCNDRGCIMEQVNVQGRPSLQQKALSVEDYNRPFCVHDEETLRTALSIVYR